MEDDTNPKKKGCLSGCLICLLIIIVLVAVLIVVGYFYGHRILPFVSDRLGIEASSVIHHFGTKAEKGMPSQFLDNAYKIDAPKDNKIVRVTTSDVPADQTYDRFIEYFEGKGWEVKKEMQALESAPEQVDSISKYLEEELRAAELARDNQRMGLGVAKFNNETVAAVWHTPVSNSKASDSEPASTKPEKKDEVKEQPEEISGSDPQDVPVYSGAIRTSYQEITQEGTLTHSASYAAETDREEVLEFYMPEMKGKGWEIVKKAETQEEIYLEATKAEDRVRIIIRESERYANYTVIEITARYRSKQ
ncbi:MAG: hypothetical protein V5B78_01580 [Desulfohalobiaceae bacterium]